MRGCCRVVCTCKIWIVWGVTTMCHSALARELPVEAIALVPSMKLGVEEDSRRKGDQIHEDLSRCPRGLGTDSSHFLAGFRSYYIGQSGTQTCRRERQHEWTLPFVDHFSPGRTAIEMASAANQALKTILKSCWMYPNTHATAPDDTIFYDKISSTSLWPSYSTMQVVCFGSL